VKPRTARGRVVARSSQAAFAVWFVLPLAPLLLWAVAARWPYPDVLPSGWGLSGFSSALNDGAGRAFGVSLLVGVVTAALAVPAGAMAAHALAFDPPPRARLFGGLLLAPVFVPPFVLVMGLGVVLLRAHIPPVVGIAVILMVTAIPYTTFLMRAAYAGYDRAIEDEARTLGASQRAVLLHVRIPLLSGPLLASTFLAFLVGWSDYVVTLIIGGGQVVTVPMKVASAASGTGNEAVVAALSVAAVLPPLLLLLLVGGLARRARRLRPSPASTVVRDELVQMGGRT
jgi:putative spermidine/putrescine transport system permease protein